MWDRILTFNQQEGRRIAALAASENARRREENKAFLDEQVIDAHSCFGIRSVLVQVSLQERRRQKEEFAQLQVSTRI